MPVLEALNKIEKTSVDEGHVSDFDREGEYVGLAVSFMIETGSYVCVAAGITNADGGWERDQAVIAGNLIRLYKIISALLDQTCQHRRETSFIFSRLAFETIVSIRYMIKNYSSDLIDSYLRHSLKHEKELRDHITENIAQRGSTLPIEDRMLKSIDRAFASVAIDWQTFPRRGQRNWGGKNLYEKAEDLGLASTAYLGAFAGPSHSVHGAWHDLFSHHLEMREDGRFEPHMDWHNPRPQPLFGICLLTTEVLSEYFEFAMGEKDQSIEALVIDLRNRLIVGNDLHESYLQAKVWPAV